ncbi:MAG: type III-A CRISPR-associated protein Csm2 [Planctomycetia bacterium]|uniref:type III-A CRISPR-associated protein Csm2 n=1 Tax=Candidatus Kuenenia sp. TaxID=2499824 RepID=UPI001DC66FC1|nr:type III-A CRISPR-associated protein Csm2 [Planctomycetia bacterium]MCL4743606.1 type III-A CRISPR-associated protein Csm2 [Phycisphaerales bacterium]
MSIFNSIKDVMDHLNGLETLSKLVAENYALEGGIANRIAEKKGNMKFTQIRKFFGHIKKIEKTIKDKEDNEPIDMEELYLLMPELAYGYGREVISKDFYDVMKICIATNKIKKVIDFKRFVELLSAVIAYHKKIEMDNKGGGK